MRHAQRVKRVGPRIQSRRDHAPVATRGIKPTVQEPHGMRAPEGAPVPLDEYGRRNMVRNVLKDGLLLERQQGLNPFKLGFIGITDVDQISPEMGPEAS